MEHSVAPYFPTINHSLTGSTLLISCSARALPFSTDFPWATALAVSRCNAAFTGSEKEKKQTQHSSLWVTAATSKNHTLHQKSVSF